MEKVITVSLQKQKDADAAVRASMDELEELVDTAGGEVVEAHTQKKDHADAATFVGKGKAGELAERVRKLKAQTVVFDDELKPSQQQNLEDIIPAKIVDRTRLILDIFAQRARTREGILQVELAQLSYMLPRITERFGRFEQQTGGIGSRGPGERKLEVDQRRIRERMAHLKKQIVKISGERSLQRQVRRSVPMPQVALVGYTNAGKSTLLNALLRLSAGRTQAKDEVYADDKLFATLDPTTRRVRLPSGRVILFSDTVGFIRKLPTQLVAAFRATLEEVATADLLIHVIDASDPAWREHAQTVTTILEELKMGQLPRVTAYNKIDLLSKPSLALFKPQNGVLISAGKERHLEDLLKAVEGRLAEQWVDKELLFSFKEGSRLARVHEFMEVISQEMTETGYKVHVRSHPTTLAQWLKNDLSE